MHRRGQFSGLVTNSVPRFVDIYDLLLPECVAAETVSTFQKALQAMLRKRLQDGNLNWSQMLSPRWLLHSHPMINKFNIAAESVDAERFEFDTRTSAAASGCIQSWLAFGQ